VTPTSRSAIARSHRWTRWTASSALVVLATAVPALAAGPTSPTTNTSGQSAGTTTHQSSPPSATRLPHDGFGTSGASPFAWVDDATILGPGAADVTVSVANWQGMDASEWEAPIVGAAVGVVPRLQLSVRAPYVMSDATAGVTGGWGTTYVSGKLGLVQGETLKFSVAPTLQVVSPEALTLLTGAKRAQFGLPISAEVDQGSAHLFASGGYFTGGIGFVGAGVGVSVSSRVGVSASLSHAWSNTAVNGVLPSRTDVSGGASMTLLSHVGVFASVSHTVATSDANSAGTTVVAGVSISASVTSRP
jgi:hypothetical protein